MKNRGAMYPPKRRALFWALFRYEVLGAVLLYVGMLGLNIVISGGC